MSPKLLLLATLLALTFAYKENEDGLLILQDVDFPRVTKLFPHLFVMFCV